MFTLGPVELQWWSSCCREGRGEEVGQTATVTAEEVRGGAGETEAAAQTDRAETGEQSKERLCIGVFD